MSSRHLMLHLGHIKYSFVLAMLDFVIQVVSMSIMCVTLVTLSNHCTFTSPSFPFLPFLQVPLCLHQKCSTFPQYSNTMYLVSLPSFISIGIVLVGLKNGSSLNLIQTWIIFLPLKIAKSI